MSGLVGKPLTYESYVALRVLSNPKGFVDLDKLHRIQPVRI